MRILANIMPDSREAFLVAPSNASVGAGFIPARVCYNRESHGASSRVAESSNNGCAFLPRYGHFDAGIPYHVILTYLAYAQAISEVCLVKSHFIC